MRTRALLYLLREAGRQYMRHHGPLVSAAIAFYAVLSAAPLIVIAVAVAGMVFGEDAARGELRERLADYLGADGASLINRLTEQAASEVAPGAAVLSAAVAVLIGSRLFSATRQGLNQVWGLVTRPDAAFAGRARRLLLKRVFAFGFVFVAAGGLMLVLVVRTLLRLLRSLAPELRDGSALWGAVELILLAGGISLFFAFAFRILPDARLAWKDIWVGAAVTAVFFTLGSFVSGMYVQHAAFASAYGAAGSAAIFLLWAYYSAQVFFAGAAFTHVWARTHGSDLTPGPHSVLLDDRRQPGPPSA